MSPKPQRLLSRRERQIMDVIYRRGEATASQVREDLADAPSYSAVRATLRILVEKGHLKHRKRKTAYVYRPTVSPQRARRSALGRLVETFFDGSTGDAVAALLERPSGRLDPEELDRIVKMIEAARRKRGR